MSAELALVSGLGIIAAVLIKLATRIEEEDTTINQGIFTLSLLFMVLLEWTAYGFAQSQGYSNAVTAYLAALVLTLLGFIGMMTHLVQGIREKSGEDAMDGL